MGQFIRASVKLQAAIAKLHDVVETGRNELLKGEVPMNHMPTTGSELQLNCCGVQDDVITQGALTS
jgi:hypothetical protein